MALANELHTQNLIKPYSNIIISAIRTAWKEWLISPYFGKWSSRGRATFVWESVVSFLEEKFVNDSGVFVVNKGTTVLFVINQEVAFRFKFADRSGRSKNIQTKSAKSFHDPEADYNLLAHTGISADIPRIEVIYTLNKAATEIDNVQMIARDRSVTVWNSSLIATQESIFEFDKPDSSTDEEVPVKRRFKGKSSDTGLKKVEGES